MKSIGIIKTASYIPPFINTNEEVCKNVPEITEQWIIERLGIKRRYHVGEYETASSISRIVANRLLFKDGFPDIDPTEIGLIVVASFSQDDIFPPMSVLVHQMINASKDCQVIYINVNCVGIITGMSIAVERMRADSKIKYAIVIGAEVMSRYVDKTDKFTAPFFSDGASGVLLGRVEKFKGHLNSQFCTDSSVYSEVILRRQGWIYQNGKATWTQAITHLPYIMKKLEINLSKVDFFIFHQANKVLIDYIMDKMRISRKKTYTNVEEIGNTGAASIGIALDEAVNKGLIKKDMLLMLVGIGAGFNFGASLWRM